MMKNNRPLNLSRIGELALLEKIFRRLPLRGEVIVGAGDDCAVVRPAQAGSYDFLLKSDGVVEGIHFNSRSNARLIGHKALGRVLSDMAAMGGEPLWALVDLVAPPQTPLKRIEEIYAGLARLAKQGKLSIVGGDVSAGKELQLHVFGVGRIKKRRAILRSSAKAGDGIFVTGALGNSLAGKHLNFQPRLRAGQWLANGKWARAMIDISDGLLRDLGHIISASGVGARLMLDKIPVSAAARGCACGKSALSHALADGEDYELLFTVPEKKIKSFVKSWRRAFKLPCAQIGWTTAQKGILEGIDVKGKIVKLSQNGFEHFR